VSRRFARILPPGAGPRPKVLVVDDHRQILDTVSGMLSEDFDVAGVATDGAEALEIASEVHPDVIVLDVDMPGLDGFETLRALEQVGFPTTPVVFMSMHDEDEIVTEAFRCGGRGYVLKSRVGRDLVNALDQALLGRVFVPSLGVLSQLAHNGGHAMQVLDSEESFLDGMAAFYDHALRRGDATCLIATRDIRAGLADRLRVRGWDVGGSSGHKRYRAVDAAEALDRFMRDGLPDRELLAEIATEVDEYRRAVTDGARSRLTICGNMSMLLGSQGNTRGALALENAWGSLTHALPFLTVCWYDSSCFHDGVPELWPGVCREHWALSHADAF
jgi:DNA-binding NarL/FixJ family response regulator